jgi:hypothetical protein
MAAFASRTAMTAKTARAAMTTETPRTAWIARTAVRIASMVVPEVGPTVSAVAAAALVVVTAPNLRLTREARMDPLDVPNRDS